jgi:hypothetical protein
MKKRIFVLLVALSWLNHVPTYSQVRFMVRDVCADTVFVSYSLRTENSHYSHFGDFLISDGCHVSDDNNRYYLPDENGYFDLKPGNEYHVLLYANGKKGTTWEKEFTYFVADSAKKDVIVDIYKIDKYFQIIVGASSYEGIHYYWYNCNELCDGQLADYYENGNIRLKGKFKMGCPTGKLYFYNEDGTLDYIEKYSRKGRLLRTIKKNK